MARFDTSGRFIRLFQLLMASPEGLSIGELMDEMGVSRRTLFRDLELLADLGFELERLDHSRNPRMTAYRIKRNPMVPFHLEDEEIMAIALVSGFSSAFPDTQLETLLDRAIDRLRKALPLGKRRQLRRMEEVVTFLVRNVAGDSLKSRFLWDLLTAIADHRVIEVQYWSLQSETERNYRLEPYRIILFEGAFYIIARDCEKNRQLRLHVGRFRSVRVTDESFKPVTAFEPEKILGQGFGISWDKKPFTVKVRISGSSAARVLERQVHPSQKVSTQPDGSLLFSMRVCGIPEIQRWILGLGRDATVLQPDWLATAVRDEAKAMAGLYTFPS